MDKFSFTILQLCEPKLLNELEAFWIDKHGSLDPIKGYNLKTVDDRGKIKFTAEVLDKMSKAHAHQTNDNLKKTYTFTSPLGEIVTFTGLSEFCRQHGLNHGKMVLVSQGKRSHHKGYKAVILPS